MIIYLKKGRRRPIWIGPRYGIYDPGAAIPDSWCPGCGTEVFGNQVCQRCAERKEY